LRNVRGFTRRPFEKQVINPNPQKGGYPTPNRVTFLNGPNRDFPKRRRHSSFKCSTVRICVAQGVTTRASNALVKRV
jgi:hypothetical protein